MNSTHTISGPMVNQQASQPAVIHIEDDIPSSIPDTIHENNSTFVKGNDVKSDKAEVTQTGIDTGIVNPEPSSSQHINSPISSQVANEKETLQNVLDNAYQAKITELKGKLKHCLSSTTLLEEENRTFREELLDWISRWKEVSAKKDQNKKAKRSIISTNQHLLERIEKQNIKIIRLKAKLTEARRVIALQSDT